MTTPNRCYILSNGSRRWYSGLAGGWNYKTAKPLTRIEAQAIIRSLSPEQREQVILYTLTPLYLEELDDS